MSYVMRPFKHMSSLELTNLILVSKISSYPNLIKNSDPLIKFASMFFGRDVISFYLGNTAGRVFSAGETSEDLDKALTQLSILKQGSIIDYCAEGETSEEGMEEITKSIESAILTAKKHKHSSVAIKITSIIPDQTLKHLNSIQLAKSKTPANVWSSSIFLDCKTKSLIDFGLTENEALQTLRCLDRAKRLAKVCKENDSKLMIDAEQTYFQAAVDGITAYLQEEFNKENGLILNTLQSYLVDSPKRLELYFKWIKEKGLKSGVKLVRGAYMFEEERLAKNGGYMSPVHKDKSDSDNCYNANLQMCLKNHTKESSLCVATHNEKSIETCKEIMNFYKLHRMDSGVTFGQLYGMKAILSAQLAAENYLVQKYIPFGPYNKLIPYLLRRAQEQSAMISDMQNQISQVVEELKLR
ncbi:hypothetical protein SteCoe_11212 [Stentor coeruleus]|uniref:Proline dehydrogenase n=1 Tax=Stentor coeruleus TaxID=5963 RepID=A0A1R2CDQ0_9CILI|nr:hypothetical protein SteCoe_11212 [Stentor coeruleus]